MKLSEFLDRYQDNDNEWFALDHGEAQRLFDAAIESIARLGTRAERAETERDVAQAEVARLRRELAIVLEVAIARGSALGYDNDGHYVRRWESLTGDCWRWDEE